MSHVEEWSPVSPGELVSLTINFGPALNGAAIVAVTSVTCNSAFKIDKDAPALINGEPTIDPSSQKVSQFVGPGFVANVVYRIAFTVQTSAGEVLTRSGRLPCYAS